MSSNTAAHLFVLGIALLSVWIVAVIGPWITGLLGVFCVLLAITIYSMDGESGTSTNDGSTDRTNCPECGARTTKGEPCEHCGADL